MRELDGIHIFGPTDGEIERWAASRARVLVGPEQTDGRWGLGDVTALASENVATHFHPGEPEALIILEGEVELHGSHGIAQLSAGDIAFIPPDTEHGLRTPNGARWLAVWPTRERIPGPRYASQS